MRIYEFFTNLRIRWKYFVIALLFIALAFPAIVLADGEEGGALPNTSKDKIFQAEVLEILDQQQTILPDNTVSEQQNIRLKGLDGEFKDKEVEFYGISGYGLATDNIYEVGDKVLVAATYNDQDEVFYYITDYVRTGGIWLLLVVFILVTFIVGKSKGLRSLVSLALTFLVIVKYIIPQILSGANPIPATLIGSIVILLIIVYLTEGFHRRSHIAVGSIFISLIITVFLSWFFVGITRLTGLFSEEVSFLITIGDQAINFKGLLLAGIIIGALGVLDDVIISQISTVEEISLANPDLKRKEVFQKAYRVGVSHISSMTNTLFLAYAGASISALILFSSGQSAFSSYSQIINNESIATEIVRTLAGSIGLILAVPISTWLAVRFIKKS